MIRKLGQITEHWRIYREILAIAMMVRTLLRDQMALALY